MTPRQRKLRRPHAPLPPIWLMTDERIENRALLDAIARLPRGSGIIFRHHTRVADARRALYDRVLAMARRRGCRVLLAGTERQARAWRADGVHGRGQGRRQIVPPGWIRSMGARSMADVRRARSCGMDQLLISPVFVTRSHPGSRAIGPMGFAALSRHAGLPAYALGGMTRARAGRLIALGAIGWAAIDGLSTVRT